jgi:uncharacterized membrane protein
MSTAPYWIGSALAAIVLCALLWGAFAYLPDILTSAAPLIIKLGLLTFGSALAASLAALLWALRREHRDYLRRGARAEPT